MWLRPHVNSPTRGIRHEVLSHQIPRLSIFILSHTHTHTRAHNLIIFFTGMSFHPSFLSVRVLHLDRDLTLGALFGHILLSMVSV